MAENCPVSCKAFKNNLGIAKDSACYTINKYMERHMLLQGMIDNCPDSYKAFKNNLEFAKDSACHTVNVYMQKYMLYC